MLCQTCTKKQTCTKVCDKVNKYLKSQGVYSQRYSRKRRETPMSNEDLDIASGKRAIYLKYGIKDKK